MVSVFSFSFFFACLLGLIVNANTLSETKMSYFCEPYEIFLPWRLSRCTVVPFVVIFFVLVVAAFARYIFLYCVGFKPMSWRPTLAINQASCCTYAIFLGEMLAFWFFAFVVCVVFFLVLLAAFRNPNNFIAFGTAIFTLFYFLVHETRAIDKRLQDFDSFSRKLVQG